MPWEKTFDLDDATDRAIAVFWNKGYEATSMADLTSAMGINKGSLYNAFGSKKALFTRALLQYDRENRQAGLAQLEAMDAPVESVRVLFDTLIAESEADTEKKGCLLVNTALELPHHDDDIKIIVTAGLGDLQAFFQRIIVSGHNKGEIPASVDPGETAEALLSLVIGLRVLARGVFDADQLTGIRNQALKLLGA